MVGMVLQLVQVQMVLPLLEVAAALKLARHLGQVVVVKQEYGASHNEILRNYRK
jgi:hypothetical protein